MAAARGKGRPSSGEAAAIADAIRDGAFAALMRDGPGVTMNAIVQASGLSRKTVYARYANKDALFVAIIRDALAASRPVLFAREGSIETRLTAYGCALLRAVREPGALALQQLLTINPDYPRALGHDIAAAIEDNFATPLRTCLLDAESAGDIRLPEPDRTVDVIVTLLLREGTRAVRDGGAAADSATIDYARFVAAFACHGLAVR